MFETFPGILQFVPLQIGISWESVFDIFTDQLPDMYRSFVEWSLTQVIDQFLGKQGDLFRVILRTPAPEMRNGGVLFGTPKQPIWNHLKTLYWSKFLPVGYLVLFLSVMVSNFGKAWGVGSEKTNHRRIGLVVGLFLIPGGWYLAVAYLKLMNLFALSVLPAPSDLQDVTVATMSNILSGEIVIASLVGGVAIVAYLLAVIVHMVRLFAIWVIVPTLPLVMGFDLGEFPILGNFSRRAYSAFIVLGAVPIPIGIGTRIMLSFQGMADKGGNVFYAGIADLMFVLVVPTFAALVPIYVFSQAADYASIRGATAALSLVAKPAGIAAAGWKAAGKKGLSKMFGSSSDDGDTDDDGGGGPDDSGPRPSTDDDDGEGRHPGRGNGSATGRGGLPKRRPSGARPDTRGGPKPNPASDVDASNWNPGTNRRGTSTASSNSERPALPGYQHTHPASAYPETTPEQAQRAGDPLVGDSARADYVAGGDARSDVDYVSDGRMVDPEVSFATHADREFARSQVIATGAASPYFRTQAPTNQGTRRGSSDGSGGGIEQSDGSETPAIVDEAAARARRRRGKQPAQTNRAVKQHERRRRRQASLRDQYYGDDS
ncbi:hypothetical protein [Halorubellus sp. PRR65]|uniref:hypothetical protein n=1 Tax=Halorubellus sp. PRR65 TaxID=3098148 RepID=UPI002B25B2DF|nr:hypothetical protein [Halorubellus sp. PRR65]